MNSPVTISQFRISIVVVACGLLGPAARTVSSSSATHRGSVGSEPDGLLAELRAANLARAREVIDRVKKIPLSSHSPPWAICHAFLVHASDFELRDPATGNSVSALRTVLLEPGSAVEVHRGAWRFRRAATPRTFERHDGQFLYLVLNSGLRPRQHGSELERRLWAIWQREEMEFHTLLDPSWFIPACCLADVKRPWTNKFGERFDGDLLLALLEAQLRTPRSQSPCAGTHALYALATVCNSCALFNSAGLRQQAERTWRANVRQVLAAILPDGDFDLKRYSDVTDPPPDYANWSLHIRGHLLECLFVSEDPLVQGEPGVHRMVSRTIRDADLHLRASAALANLRDSTSFSFASACHLAHGLRLYVQACASHPIGKGVGESPD